MDIPPQEVFFFKGKWSAELDGLLLDAAVRMKAELRSEVPGVPEQAIFHAGAKIQDDFGYGISPAELKVRVQLLETRYQTFKALVATPGVWWDPITKVVGAIDPLWLQIFKCHPFAAAYYHQDEAKFRRLAILFGPTDVKVEGSEGVKEVVEKEIVIVSDTTDHRLDVINISDCDSPFSEEVNSPDNLICEKVRRKLFNDEADSSDRESSNRPPAYYYVPGPEGKPIRKTAIASRMAVQLHVHSPKSSPGGSSQASNNPYPLSDILRP